MKDALLASVAAFNKRGGVGTSGAKLEAVVCDSRSDANGEVDCARQMVDDGVVATLNDLTFNNPAGVNERPRRRQDPADRHRGNRRLRVRVERLVSRSRPG